MTRGVRIQRWIARAMLLALPMLAGCLKLDVALTIRPDGSGVVDLTYALAESSISQFRAMMQLKDQLARAQGQQPVGFEQTDLNRILLSGSEEQVRAELRRYEKYTITVDTLKIQSVNGWRQTHLVLLFEDLARVAQSDVFREYGFNLTRNVEGNFELVRPSERTLAGGDTPAPGVLKDSDIKMLTPLLAGFHTGIRATVPGRVLASNAPRKGPNNAAWSFDFDTDPNALIALQNQSFEITFEGASRKLPEVRMRATASSGSKAAVRK